MTNEVIVLSYERVSDDGARKKTIIENGQAWESCEWPMRIESYAARALKPEERQAMALCSGLAIADHY